MTRGLGQWQRLLIGCLPGWLFLVGLAGLARRATYIPRFAEWYCATRPGMPAASTWLRSKSASSAANAWQKGRNKLQKTIGWTYTRQDADRKLGHHDVFHLAC